VCGRVDCAGIDEDAETAERGRSAFIRSAVHLYLKAKERRAINAEINAAYSAVTDRFR